MRPATLFSVHLLAGFGILMKFLNAIIIPLVFTSGCGNGGSKDARKGKSSGDNDGEVDESWVLVNKGNPENLDPGSGDKSSESAIRKAHGSGHSSGDAKRSGSVHSSAGQSDASFREASRPNSKSRSESGSVHSSAGTVVTNAKLAEIEATAALGHGLNEEDEASTEKSDPDQSD